MSTLNILSGGAAQGLVQSLSGQFRNETGFDIGGEFGAVGVMADRLRQRAPADLIILTAALVATLAEESLVVPETIKNIGPVETALAIRAGSARIEARDAQTLRDAFLSSDAIFVPDTKSSTAGIHVAGMLDRLGIADEVFSRMRIFPNGATAMRQLAQSSARRPIGCTQATEIIATDGVVLSGVLPQGYGLATMYTAAIATRAAAPQPAQQLIDLLTAGQTRESRRSAGFADKS